MNGNLIFITKDITFADLKSGRKAPIDVYEAQLKSWLLDPLNQLAVDKKKSFENGYAMFALELLFFEPHGSYRHGNAITGSKRNFNNGFSPFLAFIKKNKLVEDAVLDHLKSVDFYNITRCGIYHTMTIKSGLLMDSLLDRRLANNKNVFYFDPEEGKYIIVNPWNFLDNLMLYVNEYIETIRSKKDQNLTQNFDTTFKTLFKY